MIYRHYKGGLYLMVGYATKFIPDKNVGVEVYQVAKHTETEEMITVLLVHDKATGGSHYAFESEKYEGILCFYKDIENNYWLRPKEMFFGNVMIPINSGFSELKPRFVKMTGEELYDAISDLVDREVGAVAELLETKMKHNTLLDKS
ncbi:DUF1653 domain-containing protein [Bacillus phage Kirov]|uniref:DUF1653 domain-containing protein n=1 Tax=Bacillus phage Kirov TaxID=2783539 RepID=A0A7U3NJW2_9CAUD|nr:DUF1653 domain-containing protein [Bacillus phage Kirov]QOV08327.1 DUF1653 domain-containing protein [Bacillus phage Kirov]